MNRREMILKCLAIPMLSGCAGDVSRFRDKPVALLANDLRVCASSYVVLRNAKPGETVFLSGCNEPNVKAKDVYQAASLTKPLVAFAALQLVLDRQLDLNATVAHYLPKGYNHFHSILARESGDPSDLVPVSLLNRIPVSSLLNHTSGFPNWTSGPLSLEFETGQRWGYSGEGFLLLQSVIEAVTGMEFSRYFDSHVFAALGMRDSSLVWRADLGPRAVSGSSLFGRQRLIQFRQPVAAASLSTTASDYALFMSKLLSDSKIVSLVLSRPTSVDAALGIQWGLGWGIERARGGPYLWQWGNNTGFRAFAMASVASGDGFVVLTNSENGMPLAASIANSILPVEHSAFRFPLVS